MDAPFHGGSNTPSEAMSDFGDHVRLRRPEILPFLFNFLLFLAAPLLYGVLFLAALQTK